LTDGLTKGVVFRFKSRTVNAIGESEFSLQNYIAFGNVPDAPGEAMRVHSS
jgi:hypothetical protein